VRLEGLGQLRNPITSSGIEPANFPALSASTNYATACPHVLQAAQFNVSLHQFSGVLLVHVGRDPPETLWTELKC
jgi:hypothetical protein